MTSAEPGEHGRAEVIKPPIDADYRLGYPIDLRRADQKARAARGPLGDLELTAGRVVSRLTGERVYLQDDGSSDRMVDLRIEYSDGDPAYLEVTADIAEGYAGMSAELMRGGQIPRQISMASLDRQWSVTLSGTSHRSRHKLEAELEGILAGLERKALTFDRVASEAVLQMSPDDDVRKLVALGIVGLGSAPVQPAQGSALLYPAGISGPSVVTWGPILDWSGETLAAPQLKDVRNKLMSTGSSARHVFLGVTFTSPGEVYFALTRDEQGLPIDAPMLPPEITHIWLWNVDGGDRCIVWFPDRGWMDAATHWATD